MTLLETLSRELKGLEWSAGVAGPLELLGDLDAPDSISTYPFSSGVRGSSNPLSGSEIFLQAKFILASQITRWNWAPQS